MDRAMIRTAASLATLAFLVPGARPEAVRGQVIPESRPGPVIEGYGAVYEIPDPDLETPLDRAYRVVFDVGQSSDVPGTVNPWLDSAARFLNMHARAGVPVDSMSLAVVLHGPAAKDALMEGPFLERFGATNGNADLIRALAEAGVEFYMCGQSAASRRLPADQLVEPVEMALSAMTARAVLEARGYRLVN